MLANGAVYFRGINAAGIVSEVTRYEVTNIDTIPPIKPTAWASTAAPTNQNVTVTASFSTDTATKQYSTDNKNWNSYTSGVVMSANGTVYFRGIDAVGNISEVTSYAVTNIDKTAPTKPTATANTSTPTNQNVTVTASFSTDTAIKQYSTDNKNWYQYTSGVVMSANGMVYFRGIDSAGNISDVTGYAVTNIDKTAPTRPTATANTSTPTNQNVTVTASFSTDTATKQYSTDNSTWKTYISGVVMSANGTVYFRGIDATGNISEVTSYTVTNIDKVPPAKPTEITADITTLTSQDVKVTAAFSEDSVARQYSLNNSTWNTYTSGVVMTANGMVYFRGIDAAGNISEVTSYEVTNIDNEGPDAPIATADTTEPTRQSVTVSALFSADSVAKQYSFDGNNWQSYISGIIMDENGIVSFRSIDEFGNISAITNFEVTNIDRTAPVITNISLDIDTPTNDKVTVIAAARDNMTEVTLYYAKNGNGFVIYTGGVEFDDNGIIIFKAVDDAGNVIVSDPFAVTNIDKIAPNKPTAITADITTLTNQDVTVTATFSEDSVTRQYSLDNSIWNSYTDGVVISANGTVYFRGIDAAGNISEVTSYEVTNIDKVAPDKPVALADITEPTNQSVTVTATFSSDSVKKQYSTDNKTWKNYTASGVTRSSNITVYFRGIVAAGNIAEVTSYKVTNIDKTAPVVGGIGADVTTFTNGMVTVTATARDEKNAVTLYYTKDGGEFTEYADGVAFGENGSVTFKAVDAAGNETISVAFEVTNIDKTMPAAVTGLEAAVDKNTILFSWQATTDNLSGVAGYEIEVADSSDFASLLASQTGADLLGFSASFTQSGTYHYRVRAVDAAGNASDWSSASVEFEFTDAMPPTLPASLSVTAVGREVTFSWNASADDDSGVAGYEVTLVKNGRSVTQATAETSLTLSLDEGNYSWGVTARDGMGNVTEMAAGEGFKVLEQVSDAPVVVNLTETSAEAVVKGSQSDDLFALSPNGAWGECHAALWNGTEDYVMISGRQRYYDAIDGAGGYDVIQLASGDNALLFSDLLSPSVAGADAAARLAQISEIRGGDGMDVIDMTAAVGGYAGDLLLKGGASDDHLWAGSSNDVLIGGAGNDNLRGGAGDDLYLFGAGWGHDTVIDDGGLLVFDNSLQGKLSVNGNCITDGTNSVTVSWSVGEADLAFADVGELSGYRRDTIKAFLA